MKSLASITITIAGLCSAVYGSHTHLNLRGTSLIERQFKTLVYKGCYSSSEGLNKTSTYTYNTQGYCQQQCVPGGFSVEGVTAGTDCYCGNNLPPDDAKVDDNKCNTPCAGFGEDNCGGPDYWTVYLTGLTTSADPVDSSATSSSSSSSLEPATGTSSATPSVVTVGGETMTVTAGSDATVSSKPGAGPSKVGIATGVVVGVLVIAAFAGGGYLFWRKKQRRQVEEEHQKAVAVSSFIGNGKSSPASAGESFDNHLEPSIMASNRLSNGSLADNADYSRRILKVTNA